jgi:RNA polymerase sigma-70 factor (ECF subfamily)
LLPETSLSEREWQVQDAAMDFEKLANEHKDAVYRQMLRVCGNREDAEDVLVEALLKAYRNLESLRESEAFRAWLAQIARRVCWQLKEKEALLPVLQLSALEKEGRQIASSGPQPEAEAAEQEMKKLLNDALEGLPQEHREVYELRDVRGFPGDEVAKRLGISRAAMKSRLLRAREQMRRRLDAALMRDQESSKK